MLEWHVSPSAAPNCAYYMCMKCCEVQRRHNMVFAKLQLQHETDMTSQLQCTEGMGLGYAIGAHEVVFGTE